MRIHQVMRSCDKYTMIDLKQEVWDNQILYVKKMAGKDEYQGNKHQNQLI